MKTAVIPSEILREFETLLNKLGSFGTGSLTVKIHDGYPRFILTSEKTVVPGKVTSGGGKT